MRLFFRPESTNEEAQEGSAEADAAVLMDPKPFRQLAELRAWELAMREIQRIQRDSNFFHFWRYWDSHGKTDRSKA